MEKIEKFEGHRDRSYYLDIFIPKVRLLRDRYVGVQIKMKKAGDSEYDAVARKFKEVEQVYDDVLRCKTPEDFNAVSDHIEQLEEFIRPHLQKLVRDSWKNWPRK